LQKLDRKRKSVGFRLAAWYSLVFILSSLGVYALAYVLLDSALYQRDRELIQSNLKLYVSLYQSEGLDAVIQEIKAGPRNSLFVRIAGPTNETLFQTIPEQWDEFDLKQLEATAAGGEREWTLLEGTDAPYWFEGADVLEIASARLPDGFLLQVGKSEDARDEILEYFESVFALVMLAVLGLAFAGGALLAARSLRPVRKLAGVLRSTIETGDLTARAPVPQTDDEFDELTRLFNSLLERIESLVNRMRGALDAIAHDLRTPMTRLRGTAELALRSNQDAAACRDTLADCLEESEQVLTTLNSLMDISEAEAGAMKLNLEEVDLPALIRSVISLYQYVAEEKDITVQTALPDRFRVRADAKRLRQVVANLLDNAVKYTPAGGQVEIEARTEPERVLISIKDSGVGMEAEELPKIWDRLYRGQASLSQRGLGLGLSLVRAVVLAHKGSVDARSAPGQGSQFVISLPIDSAT